MLEPQTELGAELRAPESRYGRALLVLVLAILGYACAASMVLPTLPQTQEAFNVSPESAAWMVTSYLIGSVISIAVIGRLGDLFGHKLVMFWTTVLLVIGSVICAVAPSFGVLIAGRLLQSVSGGTFALAIGVLRSVLPSGSLGRWIALFSGLMTSTIGAAPTVGGLLIDTLGFRSIYWLTAGIAVVALVLSIDWATRVVRALKRVPVDWLGAGALAVALALPLIAISRANQWGWTSLQTMLMLFVGISLLPLWGAFELRRPHPLLDISVLRRPVVLLTNVTSVCFSIGLFGSFVAMIVVSQQSSADGGLGHGATVTGLIIFPQGAFALLGGLAAPRIGARVGDGGLLVLGLSFTVMSTLVLLLFFQHDWGLVIAQASGGLAAAFHLAGATRILVRNVPSEQTSAVVGVSTIARTIGSSLGGQISAAIYGAFVLAGTDVIPESGFRTAFAVASGAAVVGLLCAFGAARRDTRARRLRT